MASLPSPFLTPEQYLEIERKAETKSEYYNGEMFAMAGGSGPHSILASRLAIAIGGRLRLGRCLPFNSDIRVNVSDTGLYTYPDFAVVCGEPRYADDTHVDTLLNPTVIGEVISQSSESYDRGAKFGHYRTIDSLQHYVLVSQWEMLVEVFTREDDRWYLTSAGAGEVVTLTAIGVEFPVDELYQGVQLADPPASRPKPISRATEATS